MNMVSYMEDEIPEPSEKRKAELRRLSERPDNAMDYSELPKLDDHFWKRAIPLKELARNHRHKPKQVSITANIDADIFEWLKSQGQEYQTKMNSVLRHAMLQSQ